MTQILNCWSHGFLGDKTTRCHPETPDFRLMRWMRFWVHHQQQPLVFLAFHLSGFLDDNRNPMKNLTFFADICVYLTCICIYIYINMQNVHIERWMYRTYNVYIDTLHLRVLFNLFVELLDPGSPDLEVSRWENSLRIKWHTWSQSLETRIVSRLFRGVNSVEGCVLPWTFNFFPLQWWCRYFDLHIKCEGNPMLCWICWHVKIGSYTRFTRFSLTGSMYALFQAQIKLTFQNIECESDRLHHPIIPSQCWISAFLGSVLLFHGGSSLRWQSVYSHLVCRSAKKNTMAWGYKMQVFGCCIVWYSVGVCNLEIYCINLYYVLTILAWFETSSGPRVC